MSGESLVGEFEDPFLLLLIGVSTDSAIKCLKITWPRRTAYPRCYVLLCLAHDNFLSNHKNCNFLACDWFKNVLFSTNSLTKLLSDSLLLDSLLSDSLISQSLSKM